MTQAIRVQLIEHVLGQLWMHADEINHHVPWFTLPGCAHRHESHSSPHLSQNPFKACTVAHSVTFDLGYTFIALGFS